MGGNKGEGGGGETHENKGQFAAEKGEGGSSKKRRRSFLGFFLVVELEGMFGSPPPFTPIHLALCLLFWTGDVEGFFAVDLYSIGLFGQ